jgi:hypothetical protein
MPATAPAVMRLNCRNPIAVNVDPRAAVRRSSLDYTLINHQVDRPISLDAIKHGIHGALPASQIGWQSPVLEELTHIDALAGVFWKRNISTLLHDAFHFPFLP